MKITHIWSIGTILFFVFLSSSNRCWSQISHEPDFWQHLRFGGGIGLSLGNGFFSASVSPSAIYQFNRQFAAGVGLNGAYSSSKNRFTSTIVGGSAIALYNVIPQIQLSGELEELNVTRKFEYDGANLRENYWYPALFLGVGFHSNNFTMGIRYDVLFNREKSIYTDPFSPFIRMYF